MTFISIKRLIATLCPQRLKRWFQETLFKALHLKWRLPSGIEVEVLSPTDWTLLNDIFVDGEYDDAITILVDRVIHNGKGVVVDLGSNIGFFELRLLQQLQRAGIPPERVAVYGFEPDAENIAEFHRRIATAGAWARNTRVTQGLVGRQKAGSASYWKSHNHHSCTAKDNRKYRGAWAVSAPYVDVEQIVPAGPVDLLKCDIEGAELEFLEAYPELLRRVAVVIIEIHDPAEREAVRGLLHHAGLTFERVVADRPANSVHLFTRYSTKSVVAAANAALWK